MLVTTQTFHWNLERVRAYLEVQGETYSLEELNQHLEEGLVRIAEYLPPDIRQIYLMPDLASEEPPPFNPLSKNSFPIALRKWAPTLRVTRRTLVLITYWQSGSGFSPAKIIFPQVNLTTIWDAPKTVPCMLDSIC